MGLLHAFHLQCQNNLLKRRPTRSSGCCRTYQILIDRPAGNHGSKERRTTSERQNTRHSPREGSIAQCRRRRFRRAPICRRSRRPFRNPVTSSEHSSTSSSPSSIISCYSPTSKYATELNAIHEEPEEVLHNHESFYKLSTVTPTQETRWLSKRSDSDQENGIKTPITVMDFLPRYALYMEYSWRRDKGTIKPNCATHAELHHIPTEGGVFQIRDVR